MATSSWWSACLLFFTFNAVYCTWQLSHTEQLSPTQNHLEFSVRKSLFHLFDYYFDGKQELGLPENNLFEAFHSCETRRLLAGVLR